MKHTLPQKGARKHVLPHPYPTDDDQRRSNRQAWVRALRSGDFLQGAGALVRYSCGDPTKGYEYCCLGVAVSMHPDHVVRSAGPGLDISAFVDDVALTVSTTVLPTVVQDALGLTSVDGSHLSPSPTSLTFLNDHHSWSFSQIADLIESEPLGLVRLDGVPNP